MKRDIWDVLFWIAMAVLIIYILGKLTGVINTPEWVDLIPLISVTFLIGVFYQKVIGFMDTMYKRTDYLKKEIDVIKSKMKNENKLSSYIRKRNLKKSGEPPAKVSKKSSKKLKYVIQEHNASHLHWDLRLEKDGVLKSWAIPKSPPTTKEVKRLAVHVEDHPLSYAKFHGEIKSGYGKGKVKIYDKGFYIPKYWSDKKIEINIKGKKLKGDYVLIKTNYGRRNDSWLFFKI